MIGIALLLFSLPGALLWVTLVPTIVPRNLLQLVGFLILGLPSLLGVAAGALQVFAPILYRSLRGLSDGEFDEQLSWDDRYLVRRGIGKVEIEVTHPESRPHDGTLQGQPIVLRSGWFSRSEDWSPLMRETQARWIIRDDGEPRFSIYNFVSLYYAQHHVGYYSCDYDVASGVILREYCADVHYRDVVALISKETTERWIPFPFWWDAFFDLLGVFKSIAVVRNVLQMIFIRITKPNDFVFRSFSLLLTSGGKLRCPFPTRRAPGGGSLPNASETIAEQALTRMRMLLREKRRGLVRRLSDEI